MTYIPRNKHYTNIIISVHKLVALSESYVTEQHEARLVGLRETVIGTFGRHVGEVHTLSKHVPRHGRLRRGYLQAMTQNSDHVTQPGPVPQQTTVTDIFESLLLIRFGQTEDVFHTHRVQIVGFGVGSCSKVQSNNRQPLFKIKRRSRLFFRIDVVGNDIVKIGPSGAQYYFCFNLYFFKTKNH